MSLHISIYTEYGVRFNRTIFFDLEKEIWSESYGMSMCDLSDSRINESIEATLGIKTRDLIRSFQNIRKLILC